MSLNLYTQNVDVEDLIKKLLIKAQSPDLSIGVIDVGVKGGAHPIFDPIRDISTLFGFEPDVDKGQLAEELVATGWKKVIISNKGLFDEACTGVLNLISSDTNNSLLLPNPHVVSRYSMQSKWSKVGQETVALSTLDEECVVSQVEPVNFIKLDTQGTEFEILQGAKNTLNNSAVGILAEVSFFEIYKDQRLFSDIASYLRGFGFSFYGFETTHFRSSNTLNRRDYFSRERIMYADAVFVKDPIEFYGSNSSQSADKTFVVKAAVFMVLCGYIDAAFENLLKFGLVSEGDIEELAATFLEFKSTKLGKSLDEMVSDCLSNVNNESHIRLGNLSSDLQAIGSFDKYR